MTPNLSRSIDVGHLITVVLTVINSKGADVTFILEPWGETYPLGPGEEIKVVLQGPEQLAPEVEFGDDAITVYGWTGSTAKILKNGTELGAGLFDRTQVPSAVALPVETADYVRWHDLKEELAIA